MRQQTPTISLAKSARYHEGSDQRLSRMDKDGHNQLSDRLGTVGRAIPKEPRTGVTQRMSSEYFSNHANFLEWIKSTYDQKLEVLNNFQTMVNGEWQAMRKQAGLRRLDSIEKSLEEQSSNLRLQTAAHDLLEWINEDPKTILANLANLGDFTQHPRTEEQVMISVILLG